MILVAAIWGEEKTCKTSLALTFPKPLYHFDLDVGGYDRAAWRMDTKDVESQPYPTPLQIDKLIGNVPTTDKGKISIKIPKKVVGMRELWQNIMTDFVDVVQRKDIVTIVIDSATQLWSICHISYLQELQEKQISQGISDNDLRERILPREYGMPNDRMKSIIFTARSFKKNLALTHYPRDVYAQKLTDKGVEDYKTGAVDIDGFKQTKALVDLVAKTTIGKGESGEVQTLCEITLSGLSKDLEGMKIADPTYDKIMARIKMVRNGKS